METHSSVSRHRVFGMIFAEEGHCEANVVARGFTALCLFIAWTTVAVVGVAEVGVAHAETTPALAGPLHTTGTDSVIYDRNNRPVRLVGFNWGGTDRGGRNDYSQGGGRLRPGVADSGRPHCQWGCLQRLLQQHQGMGIQHHPPTHLLAQPGAGSAGLEHGAQSLQHTFSPAYVRDLKSIVSQARAAGLSVILDMQQDFWSPALHNITNWDGSAGYCEGAGMPRWLYPSIDAKARRRRTSTSSTA